ncbi:hypothetical protein [Bacillus sp. Brlt_9]|uniref:hypothetical protein n=1 Tax=Bacillus sp. Brlt_9 TaxID=3110916 RepID=UPI003F7B5B98
MESRKAPIERCPHCDSDCGYYTKLQIYGSSFSRYNFDGSEGENSDCYDGLNHKEGKVAYCIDCNKKLFKLSELE